MSGAVRTSCCSDILAVTVALGIAAPLLSRT